MDQMRRRRSRRSRGGAAGIARRSRRNRRGGSLGVGHSLSPSLVGDGLTPMSRGGDPYMPQSLTVGGGYRRRRSRRSRRDRR